MNPNLVSNNSKTKDKLQSPLNLETENQNYSSKLGPRLCCLCLFPLQADDCSNCCCWLLLSLAVVEVVATECSEKLRQREWENSWIVAFMAGRTRVLSERDALSLWSQTRQVLDEDQIKREIEETIPWWVWAGISATLVSSEGDWGDDCERVRARGVGDRNEREGRERERGPVMFEGGDGWVLLR